MSATKIAGVGLATQQFHKANGYNLDIKNPNAVADALGDPDELLAEYKTLLTGVSETREMLKQELMEALGGHHE